MQPGVGPKMGVRETWGVGSRGEPLGYMPLVNLIALSEPVSSAEEVGVKIPAAGESGHGQSSKYSDPLLHRSGSPWGPQSLLIWLLVLIFFCLSLALHAAQQPPSKFSSFLNFYYQCFSWWPPLAQILSPLAQAPSFSHSTPDVEEFRVSLRGWETPLGQKSRPHISPPPVQFRGPRARQAA